MEEGSRSSPQIRVVEMYLEKNGCQGECGQLGGCLSADTDGRSDGSVRCRRQGLARRWVDTKVRVHTGAWDSDKAVATDTSKWWVNEVESSQGKGQGEGDNIARRCLVTHDDSRLAASV